MYLVASAIWVVCEHPITNETHHPLVYIATDEKGYDYFIDVDAIVYRHGVFTDTWTMLQGPDLEAGTSRHN